jgi:hypothetical protein
LTAGKTSIPAFTQDFKHHTSRKSPPPPAVYGHLPLPLHFGRAGGVLSNNNTTSSMDVHCTSIVHGASLSTVSSMDVQDISLDLDPL